MYLLTGDRHKDESYLSEEELQIINILVIPADGTWGGGGEPRMNCVSMQEGS